MAEKTLMPEILPLPDRSQGRSPRDRVAGRLRHLRHAAVLSAACTGYGVVDMLASPSPLCNSDTADPELATAVWGPDSVIFITLDVPGPADVYHIYGGTFTASQEGTTLRLTVVPDFTVTEIAILINLNCMMPASPDVRLTLDVSAPGEEGTAVPMTVSE